MVLISSLVLISTGPVFAQVSVTNDLYIDPSCGISLGPNMQFGTVSEDAISDEISLEIFSSGNVASDLTVFATHWVKSTEPSVPIINAELTKFAFDIGADYNSPTETLPVNSTEGPVTMGHTLTNESSVISYWQVKAVVNPTTFSGAVQQTISITALCLP